MNWQLVQRIQGHNRPLFLFLYTLSQRFTGRSYVGLKQNQNMTSVLFTFALSSISHSCHRISKWHQFTCSCPSRPFWHNDSLRGHQYALRGLPMFQLISADFSWNVFLIVHISAAASVFQTTIYLWWPTANKLPVATNWFFYLRQCA